jgi:hypothetical protein
VRSKVAWVGEVGKYGVRRQGDRVAGRPPARCEYLRHEGGVCCDAVYCWHFKSSSISYHISHLSLPPRTQHTSTRCTIPTPRCDDLDKLKAFIPSLRDEIKGDRAFKACCWRSVLLCPYTTRYAAATHTFTRDPPVLDWSWASYCGSGGYLNSLALQECICTTTYTCVVTSTAPTNATFVDAFSTLLAFPQLQGRWTHLDLFCTFLTVRRGGRGERANPA